ncbi:MAG: DUF4365 domain-containing protein [Caldilineaceae bacterium]|nr:DUF4365 domain-containing protein [Caldilineaceae bacterium]HRJ40539.1 DUF4365 domain-containing protein [Caldilineaceae bacterium]
MNEYEFVVPSVALQKYGMHLTAQQEEFSIAYVHSLASSMGYGVEEIRRDVDSVDLTIRQYGTQNGSTVDYPMIDSLRVQMKCSYYSEPKDNTLDFQLKRKNYNDLSQNTVFPRILVVLHIPRDVNTWLTHADDHMILRHNAYWISLYGEPPIQAGSKVVKIPLSQRLTAAELHRLMNILAQGGRP